MLNLHNISTILATTIIGAISSFVIMGIITTTTTTITPMGV